MNLSKLQFTLLGMFNAAPDETLSAQQIQRALFMCDWEHIEEALTELEENGLVSSGEIPLYYSSTVDGDAAYGRTLATFIWELASK